MNSLRPSRSCRMWLPVMSVGSRSGVNWMRRKSSDSSRDSALTSSVLPRPGRPSSSTWPRASKRRDDLVDHLFLAEDHAAQLLHEPIGLGGRNGLGGQQRFGFWLHVRDPFSDLSGIPFSETVNCRSIFSRRCSGGERGFGASGLAGSSGELHACGRPTSLRCLFRRAGKNRNGRPVVRGCAQSLAEGDGLEFVEGKRLVAPSQIRIAAPPIDASVAGFCRPAPAALRN